MRRKKIMSIFGTRPEAIKMAPVVAEIEKHSKQFESIVVVTAQHRQMLDQVLEIFQIKPHYDLDIMEKKQTLSKIMTKSLQGLDEIIQKEQPGLVLVQGDTSTVLAAALTAFYHKIPVGHVEAGLRTFDKFQPYPEEMNRQLTTRLAELHFPPTKTALNVLRNEGITKESVFLTGNTVIDALFAVVKRNYDLGQAGITVDPNKKNILLTAHRRENLGEPLKDICLAVKRLVAAHKNRLEVFFPMHKNPLVREIVTAILGDLPAVKLIEPLDYEPFVHLMNAADLILTDSGGVQEEAPSLGKPVLVLREKTERPEAIAAGCVKLVGTDQEKIFKTANKLLVDKKAYAKMSKAVNPYGDGLAAKRIVEAIRFYFNLTSRRPVEFKSI
ncbi:UDP-N-acetylglucosamine 2-epimerase [candidate division WOR-1 bacterium RIFOXYB2_FULL_42_35]|uniref:UDP-N-acetylglucosamine 2-epimerase (non-hydrolyzing) n=1 Tax=candidate division WOR-1 bacterium RIFOXYC2_FULL_41_25 TaxID=1802586 RepID=A0A1F4TQL0_UNCSA|nr:MAG: UDP-N-acetylglucosamine 2-epimerase [candidate division WOR-1 bacterium RIFOXYA2_FULL_41_14]OGC25463.1 MAG: UDP-N-acetylglucosamine 2-epimerase [candidate division WOR-1 bacterium RIFOXYB2_FULL_42_35]OGC34869.1 MAG: UDP-N-acetylglucosamine 2-epimerase [candidate division WOR-1 bacterium RIFOXYC2_FULL_41_25]